MLNKLRDHMIEAKILKDEKFTKFGFLVLSGVIALLVADVVYLNSIILGIKSLKKDSESTTARQVETVIITPTEIPTPISTLITIMPTKQSVQAQAPTVKDYFIPVGTGSTQSGEWTDITGALTSVDFSSYPNIKEVRFEASLTNPTSDQTVWARLYNKTDKHEVWSSEVSMSGNTSSYLVSPPISWDPGVKIYQVQIKTQLQSLVSLTQSRIHIILN